MPNVLAIDDDPHVLNLLKLTFQGRGHNLFAVEGPHEVIPRIESTGIDAIILDIMLPDLSGWELLEAIRGHPKSRTVPVLVLSALTEVEHRVRALRSGADDYVVKPFHPEELLARIELLISRESRHRTELHGRIEVQPMAELLQNFELNSRSGVLEVVAPPFSGVLTLRRGRLQTAEFAGLEKNEAVLAMLDLGEGSFRFTPSSEDRREEGSTGSLESLQPLFMESAWIADELAKRLEHRVDDTAPLVTVRAMPAIPKELAAMPIVAVAAELVARPGLTPLDLMKRKISCPGKIRLALAWLAENGVLREVSEAVPAR